MLEAIQNLRSCSLLSEEVGEGGLTDDIVKSSARLQALLEILDTINQRCEKVLIFLESLKLQELLVPFLQCRYQLKHPPKRISGEVAGDRRKAIVDRFQKGEPGVFDVMILSPKAGGVGITLTAANNVIHLSRWWNPAVEDQCSDRVFRIGQNKEVNIYYPIAIHPKYSENSFDMRLHDLLMKKRDLSRQVLLPPNMSESDMDSLFSGVVE